MSLLRKFKIMHMRINGFYGGKARWWLSAKQYDQKYNTQYTASPKDTESTTATWRISFPCTITVIFSL